MDHMIQWIPLQPFHLSSNDDQTDCLMMERPIEIDVVTVRDDSDLDDLYMELFGAAPATPHHDNADKDSHNQSQDFAAEGCEDI